MDTVTVEKIGSRWIARASYEQRAIPKSAGFRWDPASKQWYTTDAAVAATLSDPEAAVKLQTEVEAKQAERAATVEASRAATCDITVPCPEGLAYLPYQVAGINCALRHPSTLFGDEMGLGKTIQAIGVMNADESIRKVLVVCPASLKLNWQRELGKWLVREMSTVIAAKPAEVGFADITIINYDIAWKCKDALRTTAWDMLIADEGHYLKNPEAKRTQALLGLEKKKVVEIEPVKARRRIILTGTPIPNRPVEGWPLFHYLDPVEFRSFWGYAKRYCDAQNNGYGWDLTGSANLAELQEKLRASIMVRRLKADVLTELPAKRRAVIELSANGASGAVAKEQEAWERKESTMLTLRAAVELAKASDDPADYAAAVDRLKLAARAAFDELAKLRHDTAVAKIPYVIEHLNSSIEDGGKVVCFAHHHDVINALATEFGDRAVVVSGEVAITARQAAVDRFQSDKSCMIFIGGIQAAGVGLTLTAASHVVFAELDWVPGNITQAEDRCHRIGQRDHVLVEHLVLEGSLDAKMAHTLVAKQEVIAAALDDIEVPALPVQEKERPATEKATQSTLAKEAATFTAEQVSAISAGLRALAAMDGDHARDLNGMGFSRIDCAIGHSLAMSAASHGLTPKQAALGAKLVRKYRRQVPEFAAILVPDVA